MSTKRAGGSDVHASGHVGTSRRIFLGATGAGVTLGSFGVLGVVFTPSVDAAGVDAQSPSAARAVLALDGQIVGVLRTGEGGSPFAQIANAPGKGKQVTGIGYEPIALALATGMAPNVYAWMRESAAGSGTRKNGAIVVTDLNNVEQSRLNFFDALISEVSLPAFDASSKDALHLGVTLLPARTQLVIGSKAAVPATTAAKSAKQLPSDRFRVSIDGIDPAALAKVAHVEALVTKIGASAGDVQAVNVSNFVISVTEPAAAPFYKWMDDVLAGRFERRTARIELLDATFKGVLGSVGLKGVGLIRVRPAAFTNQKHAIARTNAEMICESIDLDLGGLA